MATNKHCPRCGKPFICRSEEPAKCQCAGIILSERARQHIRATYTDCLCADCLRQIAKLNIF